MRLVASHVAHVLCARARAIEKMREKGWMFGKMNHVGFVHFIFPFCFGENSNLPRDVINGYGAVGCLGPFFFGGTWRAYQNSNAHQPDSNMCAPARDTVGLVRDSFYWLRVRVCIVCELCRLALTVYLVELNSTWCETWIWKCFAWSVWSIWHQR